MHPGRGAAAIPAVLPAGAVRLGAVLPPQGGRGGLTAGGGVVTAVRGGPLRAAVSRLTPATPRQDVLIRPHLTLAGDIIYNVLLIYWPIFNKAN